MISLRRPDSSFRGSSEGRVMTTVMRMVPSSWIRTAVVGAALVMLPTTSQAQQSAGNDGFNVTPRGYMQLDFRSFSGWDVTPGTGRLNRDTVEVRRLRAALDGRWKRLTFEVGVDPLDDDGVFVKDAYAQARLSRRLRVRFGQFKVPGTRDYEQSARRLDFLERSALWGTLGVGRDIGGMLDARAGRLSYQAGVFAGDGIGRSDRAGVTVAGRVVWDVAGDLELGASVSGARTTAADAEPQNGPSFRAPSSYRFAEGVYVQGQRTRFGTDVEWTPGPWRFTAEMLRLTDQRHEQGLDYDNLPDAVGTGFYTSIRRRLSRRLEAAFRYDYLGFDDAGGTTALDSARPRAADLRARANHAYTVAGTWTLNRWLRLVSDVSAERYSDPRSAPNASDKRNYFRAAARLQVELP
jgi:phosphate-selective porin